MLTELIFILVSAYFVVLLWQYRKQHPESFSEKALVQSMGTLLWLAIALLFMVLIVITYLRTL